MTKSNDGFNHIYQYPPLRTMLVSVLAQDYLSSPVGLKGHSLTILMGLEMGCGQSAEVHHSL